jgi:drug/metabolite transporter (DMT)-like permease
MTPEPRTLNEKAKILIVFVVVSLIWGSTWMFIKIGLRDLPPITFVATRFLVAVAVLLVIAALRRSHWPRTAAEWQMLAVTGVLSFCINYGLLFWGENYTSSGLAALFQATIPLFGLLLAQVYLPNEPITARRLLGVLVGLAGVGVIFARQMSVGDRWSLFGGIAIVVGAFAAAYSNVLVKARGTKIDLTVLVAVQMFCGFVPLAIIAFLKEGNPLRHDWTGMALFSILYLALLGSVTAFLLYYWLVRHMDVTKTLLISLITPVMAVVLGMIFLDETVTWHLVAGAGLIFVGIVMVVWRRRAGRVVPRGQAA